MYMNFKKIWDEWYDSGKFSGVFSVSGTQGLIFEKCCGFRNRSEKLVNKRDTAFGIASGTKLFTGLAVCKLIDEKKLALEDKLCNVLLSNDLGEIDRNVTIFHLLTHTSGIGDYIDEESEYSVEQMQVLYAKYPVYLWERLEYYLPMITPLPPKFKPGERFGYSNAGFVLLGLVVEAVSGFTYQQFVHHKIILPCQLEHTGYYRMDSLPANTAYGYISESRTNIFCMPILGGADGGLFTCADDLDKLWRALFSGRILSDEILAAFLKAQIAINDGIIEESEYMSYGLGVYRYNRGENLVFYAVGGDFGVDFFTSYFPKQQIVVSALGNTEINAYPLLRESISAFDAI